MDKIRLKDGTEFDIKDGASIGNITTVVSDFSGIEAIAEKMTKENLSKVTFLTGEKENGQYENMALDIPQYRITVGSEIEVNFGLRQLTETEVLAPAVDQAISYLTDEQALTVKGLYSEYDPHGVQYKTGDRKTYKGILYKCLQDHVPQPGWEPGVAPSLWVALESGSEAGTLEDPIPVPDTVTTSGMEYEYGKYYKEGESVYLCKRGGIPDEQAEAMYGQKQILYFAPSALIGHYFVEV